MEQPEVYVLCVRVTFPFYSYPGETPGYPTPCTKQQRSQIDLMYNLQFRFNLTCTRLDTITINMVINAIYDEFLAGIHTGEYGFGIPTTKDFFNCLYCTYGKLTST